MTVLFQIKFQHGSSFYGLKGFFTFLFLAVVGLTGPIDAQPLHGIKANKKIALTFDACMTTGMLKRVNSGKDKDLFNRAIIVYLRLEKVPATFFITGLWAEKYPELVKEIACDSLFEIGNHSYSHRAFTEDCYSLPVLPVGEKESDIFKTQEILTKLTGKTPQLFRFPGGCYNPTDLNLTKKMGLRIVGWTFASGDAFNPNTEAIVQNVLHNARTGAIVVFHLSGGRYAPKTEEVIKRIIPELKKQGYEFRTVSNLVRTTE